ncbi:MAG: preprotein translocase subunit YajC [Lachnospiraceae bacterium]
MSILATQGATAMTGFSVLWIVVMLVALYFMMIRPQQKETKRKNSMLAELAVGDTVLTTSGFYGSVIDITDDTVIVEFGNNKNCRIPMQKSAVAMVERPEEAVESK